MMDQDIFKKDNEYIVHTYQHFPIAVRCGHGASAEDFDGKTYVDFGSGIGTNSLGFCNESWVDAVSEQLRKVQHTSNLFYTLPDVLLAERLCRETGYSKVFFCNSGAEANEAAIKLARKYGREKKGEYCNRIITFKNSFHGRMITTPAWKMIFCSLWMRYRPVSAGRGHFFAVSSTISVRILSLLQKGWEEAFRLTQSLWMRRLGRFFSRGSMALRGGEVSGLGLMIGVRLEERMDAKLVASRCAENGLMILTAKTKLRIMPPLNITMDEIDRGLNVLRGCLSGLGDRDETKKNKL